MKSDEADAEACDRSVFTEKQRRVLDLLIENKTSKEIGRALGISPYTVDQRISLARGRLGVSSRNELAAHYRVMRKTLSTSSPSDAPSLPDEAASEGAIQSVRAKNVQPIPELGGWSVAIASAAQEKSCPTPSRLDYRVGPEVFEGSSGGLWRLGAIVATALFLVVTVLVMFAIFEQLNELLG